jgi:hypothetical protein
MLRILKCHELRRGKPRPYNGFLYVQAYKKRQQASGLQKSSEVADDFAGGVGAASAG